MNEPKNQPPKPYRSRGQLYEEAAEWVEKMNGPGAEKYRSEHDAWLKRGALHPSAYDRANETYLMEQAPEVEPVDANPVQCSRPATTPWALLFAAAAVSAVAASWTMLRESAPKRRRR